MEENHISKPERLVKLVQALAFQIGSTVSANELSDLVGIDEKTVERYIEILEKSFIIYTLPSYAKNQRNELKFSRKLYFWDMGIRNGVIGNMAPVSMRSNEESGHIWENFIVTEKIKRNTYAGRTFVQHYVRVHHAVRDCRVLVIKLRWFRIRCNIAEFSYFCHSLLFLALWHRTSSYPTGFRTSRRFAKRTSTIQTRQCIFRRWKQRGIFCSSSDRGVSGRACSCP